MQSTFSDWMILREYYISLFTNARSAAKYTVVRDSSDELYIPFYDVPITHRFYYYPRRGDVGKSLIFHHVLESTHFAVFSGLTISIV